MAGLLRAASVTSSSQRIVGGQGQHHQFTSNATVLRCSMKTKKNSAFHVEVAVREEEPAEIALKRFDRACFATGLVLESKRRRFFETPQDTKKRKVKEMHARKALKFKVENPTYDEVASHALEVTPFADMFGQNSDIFAETEALLQLTTRDIFGESF